MDAAGPDEHKSFPFAQYTTTSDGLLGMTSQPPLSATDPRVDANPQLYDWLCATSLYSQTVGRGVSLTPEQKRQLIAWLHGSVAALFGSAHVGSGDRNTPPFRELVRAAERRAREQLPRPVRTLVLGIGDDYEAFVRHMDRSKIERIRALSGPRLAEYMEATRRTWLWFGRCVLGRHDLAATDLSDFCQSYAALPDA